jgi:hypothetical protein
MTWKIDPDFIPVTHTTLHATDAIIIDIPESVHLRDFNTRILQDVQAIVLTQFVGCEGEVSFDVWVIFLKVVGTLLLVESKPEDM